MDGFQTRNPPYLPGFSSTSCLSASTFGLAADRLNSPTTDSPNTSRPAHIKWNVRSGGGGWKKWG